MAWGSKQNFTDQTAINGATEKFLAAVSLNPRELAHVQLKIDNEHASAVTDGLQVSVYTTLDDASETWDSAPFMQFTHKPATVSAEYFAFTVMGVKKFRIGGLSTGAANTYTMGGSYRLDGVSA
ncbi:MAG: hypothetical protein ACOY17_05340 [Pseudomonadota bacterium]|jgi:transcriptional regulator GlxA family with amidase domain|nr:hypothetical protein [Alphaproteobacteria bacterium]